MVNGAREVLDAPSFTLITILASVPTSASPGVPVSAPFELSKAAHAGLFWMLNANAVPAGAVIVGVKL